MKTVARHPIVIRPTSKTRSTILEQALEVSGIGPGDKVALEVNDRADSPVVVRKVHPLDKQFATALSHTLLRNDCPRPMKRLMATYSRLMIGDSRVLRGGIA
jgi:hypothetical protein